MRQISIGSFIVSHTSCSRRQATAHIQSGRVSVNNQVVASYTQPVDSRHDIIQMDGQTITPESTLYYYKFHKPAHIICSMHDPKNRPDLRGYMSELPNQIFPIGRLDRHTTGLLLLSNDGALAHHILHPSYHISKAYRVILPTPIHSSHIERLRRGFFLDDGPVRFDRIHVNSMTQLSVTISEGRNRIIRRAFEFLGYSSITLKRTRIGPIVLGTLRPGEIVSLTPGECQQLREIVGV